MLLSSLWPCLLAARKKKLLLLLRLRPLLRLLLLLRLRPLLLQKLPSLLTLLLRLPLRLLRPRKNRRSKRFNLKKANLRVGFFFALILSIYPRLPQHTGDSYPA